MKARAKKRRSSGPSCSFKKRIFRGNKSFKNHNSDPCDNDNSVTSPPASSSRRNLEGSCDIENELPNEENLSHYILINSDIFTELINLVSTARTPIWRPPLVRETSSVAQSVIVVK